VTGVEDRSRVQVLGEGARVVALDGAREALLAAPHRALVGARRQALGGERQRRDGDRCVVRKRRAADERERERRCSAVPRHSAPVRDMPNAFTIRTLVSRPP